MLRRAADAASRHVGRQGEIGNLDSGPEQDFLHQVAVRLPDLLLNQFDQLQGGRCGNTESVARRHAVIPDLAITIGTEDPCVPDTDCHSSYREFPRRK